MNSLAAVPLGVQVPRYRVRPPAVSSAGQDAIDIAASCGLILDPWQRLFLEDALGERADGKWAAFEAALIVARQNGKGSILEALELAALFLWQVEEVIHSAHEFRTSKKAFLRLLALVNRNRALKSRVKQVYLSKGEEGIELYAPKGRDYGPRIRFATRTGGGGRGLTGDLVILDEAYNLTDDHMAALLPTMNAMPNPMVVYTTSAPDKDLAPCEVISGVRARALAGDVERLAYHEYSVDLHTHECPEGCTEHDDPMDVGTWAKTNPGMGYRVMPETLRAMTRGLSSRAFAREVLGVGNYPSNAVGWQVIGEDTWTGLSDRLSHPRNPVCFALDVNPERSMGAIAVAGIRPDGLWHVEITDHLVGVTWMVDRVEQLVKRWKPCATVVGNFGPAAALIPDLEAKGIKVIKASMGERAAAAGGLVDACVRPPNAPASWRPLLRHLGQAPLTTAVASAVKIPIGKDGAFVLGRGNPTQDICPMVAAAGALWGFRKFGGRTPTAPFALVGS